MISKFRVRDEIVVVKVSLRPSQDQGCHEDITRSIKTIKNTVSSITSQDRVNLFERVWIRGCPLLKTMLRCLSFGAVIAASREKSGISYTLFLWDLLQTLGWVEKEAEFHLEMSYLRCVLHVYRVEIKNHELFFINSHMGRNILP